jgi:hypothetical protein
LTPAILGTAVPVANLPQPGSDQPQQAIIDSPSRSGSASLLLCAFGSMCAWQLTRSARKLHLGFVPEWYHTGGPSQIGQAVPVDLDFAVLPVHHFDQPVRPPLWGHRLGRTPHWRCESQWCPATGAARAPPRLS